MITLIDMREATRLTREGRLSEAMALLQQTGLAGSEVANNPNRTPAQTHRGAILDMRPPASAGGVWTSSSSPPPELKAKVASAQSLKTTRVTPDRRLRPVFGRHSTDASKATTMVSPFVGGARFEDRTYVDHAGKRDYKLYIPSGFEGQALPLVVMLHGCTQSPDDFAAGTQMNVLAEEHLFLVAYPAQPPSANAQKCWNWFNAADQRRDQGEPALIAGITRQIMRDFPVDKDSVYIAGLSAGGAAAAIMGSTYPDLFAAIGVHSGLACGAARDMPSAFSAMRQGGKAPATDTVHPGRTIPTIVFHGDRDTTVNAINGDQVIAQSKAGVKLRVEIELGRSDAGMNYTRTVHRDGDQPPVLEHWLLHGAGHAWSGGSPAGSYTEPKGPGVSREMIRFFLQHRLSGRN